MLPKNSIIKSYIQVLVSSWYWDSETVSVSSWHWHSEKKKSWSCLDIETMKNKSRSHLDIESQKKKVSVLSHHWDSQKKNLGLGLDPKNLVSLFFSTHYDLFVLPLWGWSWGGVLANFRYITVSQTLRHVILVYVKKSPSMITCLQTLPGNTHIIQTYRYEDCLYCKVGLYQ